MTRRAPLVAAMLLTIVAWSAAPAYACRPLAPWLQRTLQHTRPSHGGLPEEVFEKLFRDAGAPPLFVSPTSGPVPLAVRLMFIYRPLPAPVTVEITIGGGGTPWAPHVSDRYNARLDWTFAREGRYDVTARVRAAGKPDFVATATIEALSRAAFEQQRNADWAVFAGRLRRGEYQRALDCVSVNDGSRDATQMQEYAAALGRAQGVRQRLTLVRFAKDTADFTMPAVDEEGHRYEATVTFVTDPDGAWRLGQR